MHLPMEGTVVGQDGQNIVDTTEMYKLSTLEAFFDVCKANPEATKNQLYVSITGGTRDRMKG